MLGLNEAIYQMGLTDIYRTFYWNKNWYTFFSVPHGTLSKINQTCAHKVSLNIYKKIKIKPYITFTNYRLKMISKATESLQT